MPKAGRRRCRLLYVEDHADSVALVEALLAGRKDLLLLHAADAKLGIKLARARRPEAILINVDLAGMSALEFMKVLRADPATETTPILALGATAAPEAIVKGLQAGFFQVLTKPLQAGPFMEALAFALEFAAVERSEHNPLILRFGHHRTTFKEF
ncbi:MAG TPA: response regulator [Burkholderiales bacterium]|nr:response regulator [Burkholderiales bacterium]